MAEITDVDYQVEEREVTRYECDQCKDIVDGNEINVEVIYDRVAVPSRGATEDGWRHVCDDCVERERYGTLVDMWKKKKRVAEIVGSSVDKLGSVLSHVVAASIGGGLSLSYIFARFAPANWEAAPFSLADWFVVLILTFFATIGLLIIAALVSKFTPWMSPE